MDASFSSGTRKRDTNEPTLKAIIVNDAGREDLLLQVKYKGPLEESGWLIPIPSLPAVTMDSMKPFYELSQLTQQRFGSDWSDTAQHDRAAVEKVRIIEVKTIGATTDSSALARWLKTRDLSLPEGKSKIVDDSIRGWYLQRPNRPDIGLATLAEPSRFRHRRLHRKSSPRRRTGSTR